MTVTLSELAERIERKNSVLEPRDVRAVVAALRELASRRLQTDDSEAVIEGRYSTDTALARIET